MIATLREVLDREGEVVIRQADLDGKMGLTRFDEGGVVYLDSNLDAAEWRSTLTHELRHLARGPVPPTWAEHEEREVQREAARELVPDEAAMQTLSRHSLTSEVSVLARLYGVDEDTMTTAIDEYTSHRPTGHPTSEVA